MTKSDGGFNCQKPTTSVLKDSLQISVRMIQDYLFIHAISQFKSKTHEIDSV